MEHKLIILPAWDKRSDKPGKNYGVHGAEILFIVKHARRAILLEINTDWQLPEVAKDRDRNGHKLSPRLYAQLSWHQPARAYADNARECEFVGGLCSASGSGLDGEELLHLLIREGSASLFERMEQDLWVRWPETVTAAIPE